MGRSQEQNRTMREEQRSKILSVSLSLFVKRGFGATRIIDIASDASIAQGLLYRYFTSKDEILVALLEQALPRMEAAAKALEAMPMAADEKVRLALESLLKGLEENGESGRYHLLVAMASASDAIPERAREIINQYSRTPYAVMRRIFSRGQKDGSIREGDPREMALLFWAFIKGLSIHHAIHGKSLGSPTVKAIEPLFFREEARCKA